MREEYVLHERPESMAHKIIKYMMVVLAVVTIALNLWVPGFILIPVILIVIAVMMFRDSYEYEYSFFDGDFKFYSIKNKSRRKDLIRFDIDHVIAIAPKGDRAMYKYETDNTVRKYNYTSGNADATVYEIVVNEETSTYLVMIEPDEKFLDAICYKNGQKVTRK